MLNMVKGCRVQDPSLLEPGYEKTNSGYLANVDADVILPLMEHFLSLQPDHVFLFFEIPTNAKDETEITPGIYENLHMDVYYWDGIPRDFAAEFLRKHQELLVHDGMSRMGFGSLDGNDEIVREEYNVVRIYTKTPERYEELWNTHGIAQTDNLQTAWQLFTHDTPGECRLHDHLGKTIYDLVELLIPHGLYFAERREKYPS